MRLDGKRILVTAAGQGIGRAAALAFAREGASVLATDIKTGVLDSLAAEALGIETGHLDVRDPESIREGTARAGDLDVLFNCAGFVHSGTLLDATEEEWDFAFDLNVKSVFRMCRAVLPGMVRRGGGSIINMASAVSSVIAAPNRCIYGASKAAVIGLSKSIAADYVGAGIRCNCICPGTVESPSLHERLQATGDYKAARKAFIARQPIGRIGKAEEVAALCVYLASDDSAYTTGTAQIIDGGWSNV